MASQDDAVLDAPSGDAMEHVFERLLVMGPPEGFAGDGNDFESIASEFRPEIQLYIASWNASGESCERLGCWYRGMERHS